MGSGILENLASVRSRALSVRSGIMTIGKKEVLFSDLRSLGAHDYRKYGQGGVVSPVLTNSWARYVNRYGNGLRDNQYSSISEAPAHQSDSEMVLHAISTIHPRAGTSTLNRGPIWSE